jgi:hypothetical protein
LTVVGRSGNSTRDMPSTGSGRKQTMRKLWLTTLSFPSRVQQSCVSLQGSWLVTPVSDQRTVQWTGGLRAKDFSTNVALSQRKIYSSPDGVYQGGRTITGTHRREQTFLSHPKRSISSKEEMSASLTNTF